MTQWHYVADDTKAGPFATEEIQRLVSSGTLSGSTPVWKKGLQQWIRLDTTELGQFLTGPPTISNLQPQVAGSPRLDVNLNGLGQGLRVDSNVDVTVGAKANPLAYVALGLALLGFFTGLSFFPAVVCGYLALLQFKKDPSVGGYGAALAAMIISGVVIALSIIAGLFFLLLLLGVGMAG